MKNIIIKGHQFIYFDLIDSTNNFAKSEIDSLENGTIILCEKQLGGRGRRGNTWSSPTGVGIWMTLVLKPDFMPSEGVGVIQIVAAAICKSIREYTGLNALIKWPNDIVVNGKKICGILTEMAADTNKINYIIVGIGINVNNENFHPDLEDKATSLYIESGNKLDRKKLVSHIVSNFDDLYKDYTKNLDLGKSINIVKKYSAVLGREIRIVQGDIIKKVRAVDINSDGFLIVETHDGTIQLVSSGEVSIRGENSYI